MKASQGNDTVEAEESYVPDDLDQARAAVRFCKELWGADVVLEGFTADYSGAFRQDPLHPEQVPYKHPEQVPYSALANFRAGVWRRWLPVQLRA